VDVGADDGYEFERVGEAVKRLEGYLRSSWFIMAATRQLYRTKPSWCFFAANPCANKLASQFGRCRRVMVAALPNWATRHGRNKTLTLPNLDGRSVFPNLPCSNSRCTLVLRVFFILSMSLSETQALCVPVIWACSSQVPR
jgi:hypothetical protein